MTGKGQELVKRRGPKRVDAIVVTGPQTAQEWADEITAEWRKSVGGIIQCGRLLLQAKAQLEHGQYLQMFKIEGQKNTVKRPVPWGRRMAHRLCAVARSPVLSNGTYTSHLPASWYTLYILTLLERMLDDGGLVPLIESGKITAKLTQAGANALVRDERKRQRKKDLQQQVGDLPLGATLHHGDFAKVCAELVPDVSVDAIVTDPPYAAEFLPEYKRLSEVASRVLKPNGNCLVMCGQAHILEALQALTTSLTYNWMLCYYTPGQSVAVHGRRVKVNWKPVVWLVNGKCSWKHVQDVLISEKPDKNFHEWGQSMSGTVKLVEEFTLPGAVILDPFCGAGTTGVAALQLGRRFIGIDRDEKALQTTRERLAGVDG